MFLSKLCWVLLELVWMGTFFLTGSAAALALMLGMLLLPLLCLPVNLLVRKRLRVHLELPVNLRKGESGRLALVLENPALFPVFRMGCTVQVENQLNGMETTRRVSGYVLPRQSSRILLEIGDLCCGRLTVSVKLLRLYDGFGLLPVTWKGSAARSVTVQPDTFTQRVQLLSVAGTADDSELYSDLRPGMDMTETFQIREYVEGDSMRQIHWKLTGKFDRLIVRDPSLPIIRSVLLFWERTGDTGDFKRTDAQAEVLITLCKTLLDQSVQFTVGWNDTRQQRCVLLPVHDLEELVGVTPRILSARGQRDGATGMELLLQTLGDQAFSHIVCLGENLSSVELLERLGHVTVLSCGETAAGLAFAAENYPQQLAELVI